MKLMNIEIKLMKELKMMKDKNNSKTQRKLKDLKKTLK